MGRRGNPAEAPQGAFLFIINGEPSAETAGPSDQKGKKRPHHKSRHGCLACKRRRVKCDERLPCSNCLKMKERCIHSSTKAGESSGLSACTSQPSSPPVVDDTRVNLLHLELFSHFQTDIIGTLGFPEIWQQVLPWSFQEPYIMCTILCLAATHLSMLRPHIPRYSHVALQLLGKSASLFSEKLSNSVTAQNSEALVAASILMNYISWSHIEFLEEHEQSRNDYEHESSIMNLPQDPLFQLSSAVRGIYIEAFSLLETSDNVFFSAICYSPKHAIEEAISQQGQNPNRFVDHFMTIWDDPRYQSTHLEKQATPKQSLASPRQNALVHREKLPGCSSINTRLGHVYAPYVASTHGTRDELSPQNKDTADCPHVGGINSEEVPASPPHIPDLEREAFERIAKRLSLLFCLVSISTSAGHSPSPILLQLQPDIERCFFTFPVICGAIFRSLTLHGDPRALVMLCHFYRAARILLTSPSSWWALQRSHVIESLILRDLTTRGLDTCILGGEWDAESN